MERNEMRKKIPGDEVPRGREGGGAERGNGWNRPFDVSNGDDATGTEEALELILS